MNNTDHSAAHRLLPIIGFGDYVDFSDYKFWFGSGIDSGKFYFQKYMVYISGYNDYIDDDVNIGGIMNYIIDYGFVIFCFFVLLVKEFIYIRGNIFLSILWIAVCIPSSFNSQFLWYSLTLLMFVNYHDRK